MIQDLEFDIDLKRKTISKEYCKQNDTLNLIFNIYDNGEAVDLTGFTAILNCNINNTNQVIIKNDGINIDYNKITIFDKDKYITCLGENATLEIVLSKDDIQKTSFNISLEVDKSIMNTTGHLEEVVITALANLQEDLNKASATVQKLEEENTKANNNTNSLSTENTRSETNYNNLKNINNNLSDLLEANSTAETNINNLITENNKATANIEAMQKLGDVTNLAQQVETNKENITEITTQLNENVQDIAAAKTNINNLDSSKAEKVELQQESASRKQEIAIERSRIDNLVKPENSTDNAETADVRIGADGITYNSAGTAVREQFNSQKKKLLYSDILSDIDFTTATKGFVHKDTTLYTDVDGFYHTDEIALKKGDTIIANVRGYEQNVAIFSLVNDDGSFTPKVISRDSTVQEYIYTASYECSVIISYGINNNATYNAVKIKSLDREINNCVRGIKNVYDTSILTDANEAENNSICLISVLGVKNLPYKGVGMLITISYNSGSSYKTQIFASEKFIYYRSCLNTWSEWDCINKPFFTGKSFNEISKLYCGIPKMGIIGDSLSSGCTWNGKEITTNYNLSWGKRLQVESGNDYKWFSKGGLSTRTWLTDTEYGLTTAIKQENFCNAYIMFLMTNDHYAFGEDYVGTINDIDVSNSDNNKDSFYGNYAKIIQKITSVNPNAKFFLMNNPRDNTESYASYNKAVSDIADKFDNCYLLDMSSMFNGLFNSGYILNTKGPQAHYPGSAYSLMAEYIKYAIGKVMYDNYSDFLYVQF